MTKDQKTAYLKHGGVKCPYCDEMGIEGRPLQTWPGRARQKARCNKCGQRWWDMYALTGVEPDEE